jgi:hypothetical protein
MPSNHLSSGFAAFRLFSLQALQPSGFAAFKTKKKQLKSKPQIANKSQPDYDCYTLCIKPEAEKIALTFHLRSIGLKSIQG